MNRKTYLENAMTLPLRYLWECVHKPGHMKPAHVLLMRVALRRKLRELQQESRK